jgi:predicted Zn-dependent protease
MPGVVGPDRFAEVAAPALELRGVDGVEVVLVHEWGGLTRFANSEIHQSTSSEDTGIRVRVVRGGRVGVAATNDFSPEGARRAAASAKEMADVSGVDPLWPGLTPPTPVPDTHAFDDATADCTPERRAGEVAALVATCPDGFVAAGAYETRAAEIGVANSDGQACWGPWTQATLTTVMTGGDSGSGFGEAFAATTEGIEAESIGRTAAAKAVRSQSPRPLDAGTYPVVLEPAATATLVGFLAWVGFAGKQYVEERSCFSGKGDQQVAHPAVSIWDDATDPRTIGIGFDFEGEPKRRVDLIKRGVFHDAVYDRRTAKQAGRQAGSTGHGLPAPNPEGPFPLHLFMDTGEATVDEMVVATERGLLVTRFHYSNVVNPMESSITGMTRDGTFLIEHGEIVTPVRNFRFTQSIIAALSAVSMVGRESVIASEFFFSASRVPAVKIEEFHFSGVSDH